MKYIGRYNELVAYVNLKGYGIIVLKLPAIACYDFNETSTFVPVPYQFAVRSSCFECTPKCLTIYYFFDTGYYHHCPEPESPSDLEYLGSLQLQ